MVGELNLRPDRGPNVWNESDSTRESPSKVRRIATGIGGAALVAAGAMVAVKGATALYHAAVGGPRREPEGRSTTPTSDLVNDESAASFPASDAPSWTPTAGAVPDIER